MVSQLLHSVPLVPWEGSRRQCVSFLLAAFSQFCFPRSYIAYVTLQPNRKQVEKRTSRNHVTRSWEPWPYMCELAPWDSNGPVQQHWVSTSDYSPACHILLGTPSTITSASKCVPKVATIRCDRHVFPVAPFQLRSSISRGSHPGTIACLPAAIVLEVGSISQHLFSTLVHSKTMAGFYFWELARCDQRLGLFFCNCQGV